MIGRPYDDNDDDDNGDDDVDDDVDTLSGMRSLTVASTR